MISDLHKEYLKVMKQVKMCDEYCDLVNSCENDVDLKRVMTECLRNQVEINRENFMKNRKNIEHKTYKNTEEQIIISDPFNKFVEVEPQIINQIYVKTEPQTRNRRIYNPNVIRCYKSNDEIEFNNSMDSKINERNEILREIKRKIEVNDNFDF